jgi:hypothetical protein
MVRHESMVLIDLILQASLIAPCAAFAGENEKRACQKNRCGINNSAIQGLGLHRRSSFVPLDDEDPWIV